MTPAAIPLIGLSTYRVGARWGVWDEAADLLPATYADAIALAGGVPVLLPPAASDGDCLDAKTALLVDRLDGLVIAGGPDVDPAYYDEPRHDRTDPPAAARDRWEFSLVGAAVDRGLPLLGVCRGLQVLNVARGGSLIQHLPDTLGHTEHSPTVGVHGRHEVRLAPDSRLSAALGPRRSVATYHHQAVDRLGDGLRAIGWTDDGTVEAIELDGPGWVAGVQWHPEAYDGQTLFAAFIDVCRAHRAQRADRGGVVGG